MAIHMPETDTLLLEVPKTGSTWLTAALAAAGVNHRQIGPARWRGHGDLTVHPESHAIVACFVREPISWYRSYFAYRIEHGWRPKYTLDHLCESDSFTSFVRSACTQLPGFLAGLYARYAGRPERQVTFVGRTEHLADDLVRLLHLAEEKFDENALRSVPPINTTSVRPSITREIEDLIYISEYEAACRFGYVDSQSDPFSLQMLADSYPDHLSSFRRLALWTEQCHWRYDDARQLAHHAAPDSTRHARILTNFGLYVQFVLGNTALAGALYRSAVREDPGHPRSLGTLAVYAEQVENDPDTAETLFEKALRLRPCHPEILGNFALFQKNIRENHGRAEWLYIRALNAQPAHAKNLGNYAVFLYTVRHDYGRAGVLFRKAFALDPGNSWLRTNYDVFRRGGGGVA
jgi:tetratricopeptide (TPR) repeat protein